MTREQLDRLNARIDAFGVERDELRARVADLGALLQHILDAWHLSAERAEARGRKAMRTEALAEVMKHVGGHCRDQIAARIGALPVSAIASADIVERAGGCPCDECVEAGVET